MLSVFPDNFQIAYSKGILLVKPHVFLDLLTNYYCSISGVFTVSGIIDSFVYHGHRAIKKKMEIGKFS